MDNHTTKEDILIILGDAGINYYGDWRDERLKLWLSTLPIKLFCIHGNHEMRPETIDSYGFVPFHGALCWSESAYPNILFAMDGSVYRFGDKHCLVIGGAYSIDKYFRLENGLRWFEDEQPSSYVKHFVQTAIEVNSSINTVLSHTCPYKYVPTEMFLPQIDQSTVDVSTEKWLDTIEESLNYEQWYCGHYHTDKSIDKIKFLFNSFDLLTIT